MRLRDGGGHLRVSAPSMPDDARQRGRSRKTRRSVILKDRAAGLLVRGGGAMVVAAVVGICVFLVWVAAPLFADPDPGSPASSVLPPAASPRFVAAVDEYHAAVLTVDADGAAGLFLRSSGGLAARVPLVPEGARVGAVARDPASGLTVLALADGQVAVGRAGFAAAFPEGAEAQRAFGNLVEGVPAVVGEHIAERLPGGLIRVTSLAASAEPPARLGKSRSPIVLLDCREGSGGEVIAALRRDGTLAVSRVRRVKSLVTGAETTSLVASETPLEAREAPPSFLLITTPGDALFVGWEDGVVLRHEVNRAGAARVVERIDLTAGDVTLGALAFSNGEQSLLAGASDGRVTAWFRVPPEEHRAEDGFPLVPVRSFSMDGGPVRRIAVSLRDRNFAAATDSALVLCNLTSGRVLRSLGLPFPAAGLQVAPKSDALFVAAADGRSILQPFSSRHPEISLGTVFLPTWYEGHPGPSHTWQTSSGTDDSEPKFGLVPLIFGTLKATFYALLFAVPVAILAAVYTSEFMSRRTRAFVKPKIEMMASLPSVVLGFLAALVIAPFAEDRVAELLMILLTVPVACILGGAAWSLLPAPTQARLDGPVKALAMTAAVLGGIAAAFPAGRVLEDAFFLGDLRIWLAPPRTGGAAGFLACTLFLPSLALAAVLVNRFAAPFVAARRATGDLPGGRASDLLRWLVIIAAATACAAAAGFLLDRAGLDPRDGIVGTYAQRNALIIGFAMGFAVIPIIYTIAEDALSAVPNSLRSASLACGATRWQTALTVVLPTALSGIFSSVMIGLGRAVGETMIVVLAAGNTPILDVSPFNGLRPLSATIAVELPEAVRNSTLYRMLFLAALVLFAMTFVINTVAELVRMRFRRRAFEL